MKKKKKYSPRKPLHPNNWGTQYGKRDLCKLFHILYQCKTPATDMSARLISYKFFYKFLSSKSMPRDVLNGVKKSVSFIENTKRNMGSLNGFDYEIKRFARFMYELPLEDMPLYINEKAFIPYTISRWRLEIGK